MRLFREQLICALGVGCLLVTGCGRMPAERAATDGRLDLRSHRWKPGEALALVGSFRFHWKQFADPGAGRGSAGTGPVAFQKVPGSWNSFLVDGKPIGGRGYGSYGLHVLLPDDGTPLAMRVLHFDSAHRLFVNGRIVHEAGVVGTTQETTTGGLLPAVIDLPQTRDLNIVVHVSNFQHRNGGFPRPLVVGERASLHAAQLEAALLDAFLFGTLLMIGLYHLGLYALRRADRSALFLALFCLLMTLRTVLVGERIVEHILPGLPFWLEHRLKYMSFFLATPVFLTYASLVFEGAFRRAFTLVVVAVSLLAACFVIAFPSFYYSQTNVSFQILTVIVGVYILITVVRLAWAGRPGAGIFLFGFGVLFATVLNDILYSRWFVQTGTFVSFGLFFFVLAQAFLLSQKLLSSYQVAETLAVDLANSERRYRHLVEDSGEIIVSLDDSGLIQNANRAVRTLLGLPPQKVVGRPLAELLHQGNATNSFLGRHILDEHMSRLRDTGAEQEFSAEFRTVTGEACELAVRLQMVEQQGDHAVIGNLSRRAENVLARYCREDRRTYEIATSFSLAELVNRSLTSALESRLSEGDLIMVRLALREILANAIEHGNLNISFEEKTAATDSGRLFDLFAERLAVPKYGERTLRVSVELREGEVTFQIEDQGAGFDHAAMRERALALENLDSRLLHGRGLAYALSTFDRVDYNEAGNSVQLLKRLPVGVPARRPYS